MQQFPQHIGFILDGNGRWALQRGLKRTQGHEEGAKAVRRSIRACRARSIPYVTLYVFSVANWSRPKEEVDNLMRICAAFAEEEREELKAQGVCVRAIGELDEIPAATRRTLERLIEDTAEGKEMTLSVAINYGGRRELVSAVRSIAAQARVGLILPEEIDEESLRSHMTTAGIPCPDLIVRTGGEKRLSDFLLFEASYAELFFSDILWPDFSESILDEALASYGRRRRRFGRTDAQLDWHEERQP